MFGFFERLVDPFPGVTPEQPPRGIYQFCRHHVRGMERWLILMAILTAITAISEAMLLAFWVRWSIGWPLVILKPFWPKPGRPCWLCRSLCWWSFLWPTPGVLWWYIRH